MTDRGSHKRCLTRFTSTHLLDEKYTALERRRVFIPEISLEIPQNVYVRVARPAKEAGRPTRGRKLELRQVGL